MLTPMKGAKTSFQLSVGSLVDRDRGLTEFGARILAIRTQMVRLSFSAKDMSGIVVLKMKLDNLSALDLNPLEREIVEGLKISVDDLELKLQDKLSTTTSRPPKIPCWWLHKDRSAWEQFKLMVYGTFKGTRRGYYDPAECDDSDSDYISESLVTLFNSSATKR